MQERAVWKRPKDIEITQYTLKEFKISILKHVAFLT